MAGDVPYLACRGYPSDDAAERWGEVASFLAG